MFYGSIKFVELLLLSCLLALAGRYILAKLRWNTFSRDSSLLVSFAMGSVFFIWEIKLLALLQWLNELTITLALAVVVFLAVCSGRQFWKSEGVEKNSNRNQGGSKLSFPLCVFVITTGVYLLLAIIRSFYPPYGTDSLNYHLSIPQEYLRRGGIEYIPWIFQSSQAPLDFHMLLIPSLLFAGKVWGGQWMIIFGLLTVTAIYLLLRQFYSTEVSAVATLVFTASVVTDQNLSVINTEIVLSFYLVTALLLLVEWYRDRKFGVLCLAALFLGETCSIKHQGLVLVLLIGPLVTVLLWKDKSDTRVYLRQIFLFSLIIFTMGSFWYVRNWIYTGNPVYPYLFGGDSVKVRDKMKTADPDIRNVKDEPAGRTKVTGEYFFALMTGVRQYRSILYNPALLVFLPILLFGFWTTAGDILLKAGVILSIVISGFLSYWTTRYWFVFYPLFLLFVGRVLEYWMKERKHLVELFVWGQVLFLLGITFLTAGVVVQSGKFSTEEEFYSAKISEYPLIQYINSNIQADRRVVFFGWNHSLVEHPNTIFCDFQQQYINYYEDIRNPFRLEGKLRQAGADYIAWTLADSGVLKELEQKGKLILTFKSGQNLLYKFNKDER